MKALTLREQAEVQAELLEEITMQDVLEMSAALDRWDAEIQEQIVALREACQEEAWNRVEAIDHEIDYLKVKLEELEAANAKIKVGGAI